MKYLEVSLPKHVQDVHSENGKSLEEEIRDNLETWTDNTVFHGLENLVN
jgi:hypothetical protein